MSLKFGKIRPLVFMVTDRVMMGKTVSQLFSAVFHPFFSTLAGNNDMHENFEELESWLDPTTGVSCPRAS